LIPYILGIQEISSAENREQRGKKGKNECDFLLSRSIIRVLLLLLLFKKTQGNRAVLKRFEEKFNSVKSCPISFCPTMIIDNIIKL